MRDGRFNARAVSAEYNDACVMLSHLLVPGQEVPADMPLFVVSNGGSTIGPNFFQLRDADRQPLAGVNVGGKSSHVAFTKDVHEAIGVLFDRPPNETDTLFVLPQAKLLHSAGYRAFHAPTGSFELHLRLVQEAMLEGKADDVSESARRSLARLFKHNAKRVRV